MHGLTALVPLAWAVLLLHPAPDPDDIFGSLRLEANPWLLVHLGALLFLGLTGAVLYLLLRDLQGPSATLSRVATGTFVRFYGAAEVPWRCRHAASVPRWRSIRCVRDGHRNGAGAVDMHHAL